MNNRTLDNLKRSRAHLKASLGDQKIRVPAQAEDIAKAEKSLDITFPPFLRCLFGDIGNGGFGPAYGIMGIGIVGAGEGVSLEETYLKHIEWCAECSFPWPKNYMPLIDCGCGIYLCLDCANENLDLYEYDPNIELDETDPRWMEEALQSLDRTLEELLENWLKEINPGKK